MDNLDVELWRKLPLELAERALLFLPVPTLCRFRMVCKRWDALICHPEFGIWSSVYSTCKARCIVNRGTACCHQRLENWLTYCDVQSIIFFIVDYIRAFNVVKIICGSIQLSGTKHQAMAMKSVNWNFLQLLIFARVWNLELCMCIQLVRPSCKARCIIINRGTVTMLCGHERLENWLTATIIFTDRLRTEWLKMICGSIRSSAPARQWNQIPVSIEISCSCMIFALCSCGGRWCCFIYSSSSRTFNDFVASQSWGVVTVGMATFLHRIA